MKTRVLRGHSTKRVVEMDILIHYHFITVEILLSVMVLNIFLPQALKGNPLKSILFSRIGYFAFWASWSMAVFSGTILFVFTRHQMTTEVVAMIVLSVLLPILDGYRAIKSKRLWMRNEDALSLSFTLVMVEITATLLVVYISKGL